MLQSIVRGTPCTLPGRRPLWSAARITALELSFLASSARRRQSTSLGSYPTTFSTVDRWVWGRLRSISPQADGPYRSRSGNGSSELANAFFAAQGYFSLVTAYAAACRGHTIDGKAGCGRPARPVWRQGAPSAALPTPIKPEAWASVAQRGRTGSRFDQLEEGIAKWLVDEENFAART